MKYKSGDYTGESFSDGSIRIWKEGFVVCEIYAAITYGNAKLSQKQFDSLCRAIEKNCHPYRVKFLINGSEQNDTKRKID